MNLLRRKGKCALDLADEDVCSSDRTVSKMQEFLTFVGRTNDSDSSPGAILKAIKEEVKCPDEACVLAAPEFVKFVGNASELTSEINTRLVPKGPARHDEWLSNEHIDAILKQLSRKHEDFLHIEYQMRDFQKMKSQLATTDFIEEYKKGMRRFGCVFNTDYSTGRGEHWYSLFVDFTGSAITIEYFDSMATYPQPELQEWMTALSYKLAALGKPTKVVRVLNKAIQKNNHDCGVYSIYYIWARLSGIPYSQFADPATAPDDSVMQAARSQIFR